LGGVRVYLGSQNTIGGSAAGAANTIAFNTQAGVSIVGNATAQRNVVSRNSTFSNTGLGIDLLGTGVNLNDIADPDNGPNNLQNFPQLSSTVLSGNTLTINYNVPSAIANSAYDLTVEFFIADAANQEGQTFIGSHTYVQAQAIAIQQAVLNVTGLGVALGQRIIATATDAQGNTSEFTTFGKSGLFVAPLLAAGGEQMPSGHFQGDDELCDIDPDVLQSSELQPIVAAATTRWQQVGLSASQLAGLQAVTFEIVDLPDAYLGLGTATTIQLDATAAGYGWFVDPTPEDDDEFTAPSSYRQSAIDHRQSIDLLTAVMHEMGHVLGYDHDSDFDAMFATLAAGVGRGRER
jgi:hypothetical protein